MHKIIFAQRVCNLHAVMYIFCIKPALKLIKSALKPAERIFKTASTALEVDDTKLAHHEY